MDKKNCLRKALEQELTPERSLFIKQIGAAADEMGFSAFIVGGAVRDLLFGSPPGDIDITVEGDAGDFAKRLSRELKGKVVVHGRFKTASMFFKDGSRLDISTARKEKYKRPAELPEVVSSSIYNDLYRRDFTINALAVAVNPGSFGTLIDCFKGLEDLHAGIIRVLHEESFKDDPTRIFRAARFSSRFGFEIEERTQKLMQSAIRGRFCDALSGSRIKNEIKLLLSESDAPAAVNKIREYGIHKSIHPALRLPGSKIESLKKIETNLPPLKQSAPFKDIQAWLVYFMEFLRGHDEKTLSEISERLMLSRKESDAVRSLSRAERVSKKINTAEELPPSEIYMLLRGKPAEFPALMISSLDEEKARSELKKYIASVNAKPETKGTDIIKLGFEPGPGIRPILDEVLKAKIDGIVRNKKEEIEFIRKQFGV